MCLNQGGLLYMVFSGKTGEKDCTSCAVFRKPGVGVFCSGLPGETPNPVNTMKKSVNDNYQFNESGDAPDEV